MTCKKIYCVGTFPNCGNIQIPIGLADGDYDLVIQIGRRRLNMEVTVTAGIVELCTSYLSVDREIYLQFYQSGQLIVYNGYDAFTFTINNYGSPGPNNDCSVPPCNSDRGGGDLNYVYYQNTPSATWTIIHNLGKLPSVTVIDSGGDEVEGSVNFIDNNILIITYSAPFSGKATLN